jgi:hypothetical protein
VVVELREGDNGVQEEATRMMAWSKGSGVSCNDVGGWLEVSGDVMPCRARRKTTCRSGFGKWCSYQRTRSTMRSRWRSLQGRGASGPWQSLAGVPSGGQRVLVGGGLGGLVHKRANKIVRELR